MLVLILFGLMLIIMLMRVGLLLGAKVPGKKEKEIPLSFQERLIYHRFSIYGIGAVLLMMTLTGQISSSIEMVVILATFAIVTIPIRYIITMEGIGLNNVLFRPWRDFRGMSLTKRQIVLVGAGEWRSMKLGISPASHEKDVQLLTRFLKTVKPEQPSGKLRKANKGLIARYMLLALIPILVAGFFLANGAAHAQGPVDPQPDRSGLNTGTGTDTDLIGDSPGTLTQDDFDKANTSEPFAVKLSTLVEQNRLASNFTWTLVTGFLVMFMQAGFALVETGFCRAKNAMHVMLMNFMIYGLGMLGYFICGFALQFGGIGNVGVPNLGGLATLNKEATINIDSVHWGLFGEKGFFLIGPGYDVGVAVMFLFQMVFMDTTATIPTGAMAERWKWSAFCVYGFFIGGFIYPIYGNWAWGGLALPARKRRPGPGLP